MVYTLLGADGRPYRSAVPGTLGGHRRLRIYGLLTCPSARRALARGHYARHRVFFADERTAVAAGYRPCAVCLPDRYRAWRTSPTVEAWRTASSPGCSSASAPATRPGAAPRSGGSSSQARGGACSKSGQAPG
ncbi:Ada metal-binding domain-containing protein [Amycolatopsis thermoflava]|uniref:Ada metal-binding domain-containing protein n=1 Tax=Amycolatopsis thermoflava TaxID=84480 RepID=UPI00364753F7